MKLNIKLKNKNALTISDMHVPYHHPDAIRFLAALHKKYKFDIVFNMGDLADFHNISFHKSDPDLLSAGDELKALRKTSKILEKLFPEMIIIGSNHGDLPIRKFLDAGLPFELLRKYNDIYGVGKGWKFVDDVMLVDGTSKTYLVHSISKSGIKVAGLRGVNVVQGHFHTDFRIDYISNPMNLLWSMQVGCLIDRKSKAFAYNMLDLARPILGCGGILNGLPTLFPMTLDKNGRWNGVVP